MAKGKVNDQPVQDTGGIDLVRRYRNKPSAGYGACHLSGYSARKIFVCQEFKSAGIDVFAAVIAFRKSQLSSYPLTFIHIEPKV